MNIPLLTLAILGAAAAVGAGIYAADALLHADPCRAPASLGDGADAPALGKPSPVLRLETRLADPSPRVGEEVTYYVDVASTSHRDEPFQLTLDLPPGARALDGAVRRGSVAPGAIEPVPFRLAFDQRGLLTLFVRTDATLARTPVWVLAAGDPDPGGALLHANWPVSENAGRPLRLGETHDLVLARPAAAPSCAHIAVGVPAALAPDGRPSTREVAARAGGDSPTVPLYAREAGLHEVSIRLELGGLSYDTVVPILVEAA